MATLDNLKLAQLNNTKLEMLAKAQEEYKAKLAEQAKEIIKEVFETFFVKTEGKVEAVKWQQYTPYFNDGEPCTFRVYEPDFKFKGIDTGGYDDDGFLSEYVMEHYAVDQTGYSGQVHKATPGLKEVATDALRGIAKELAGLIDSNETMEEVLLTAFGDHVVVTATPDGKFEVEEYNHE